jgi:hypothetical protein
VYPIVYTNRSFWIRTQRGVGERTPDGRASGASLIKTNARGTPTQGHCRTRRTRRAKSACSACSAVNVGRDHQIHRAGRLRAPRLFSPRTRTSGPFAHVPDLTHRLSAVHLPSDPMRSAASRGRARGHSGTTIVTMNELSLWGGAVCDFQSRAEPPAFQAVVRSTDRKESVRIEDANLPRAMRERPVTDQPTTVAGITPFMHDDMGRA